MNEQLEPCPFCGHAMMYFGDDCSWNVFDTNIRCPVQPSLLHNLETREAAIAAWNTRAPVESGTVSGERVRRLVGWHPPGRPGDTCMPKYEVVPAPPLSPATPSVTVEAAVRAAREWWIREHGHGVEGVRKLVDESDIEECVRFLSLPRAPAKETAAVEAAQAVPNVPRLLAELREIENAVTHFDCECDSIEGDACPLCRVLVGIDSARNALESASPRSAVEAEVVEAAKAVHEAGSVLARHFNGPFAVWTAWNVACETLDRALARAQEGRGT